MVLLGLERTCWVFFERLLSSYKLDPLVLLGRMFWKSIGPIDDFLLGGTIESIYLGPGVLEVREMH